MLEGQDVPKTLVVVHRSDRTAIPGSTEIEAGAMLTSTFASARVSACAFQPVGIRENVEPCRDSYALAQVGSAPIPDAFRTHEPREISGPSLIE